MSFSALPPVAFKVRSDPHGSGMFGASRLTRKHRGVDLLVRPGEDIRSPISGRVSRLGVCYRDTVFYRLIEIEQVKSVHRILYMVPGVAPGTKVTAGEIIGTAQDVSLRYDERMLPHIHWEVRVDPDNVLMGKGEQTGFGLIWINPELICDMSA